MSPCSWWAPLTQFHCDVDSIGDDADALAMTDAARQLGGCGTSADCDSLTVGNQTRRRETDLPFFRRTFLLLFLKRRQMSEGLIEHWRHGAGASVIATQQPLSFKLAQVAPDRSTGDFKVSG